MFVQKIIAIMYWVMILGLCMVCSCFLLYFVYYHILHVLVL